MSPQPGTDGLDQDERAAPFSPALHVTPARPLIATETRLAVGQGQVRTVIPVPRGDHLHLQAARFFLRASNWRVFASPT